MSALQQNLALVPHATALLEELQTQLERLIASTIDFLHATAPLIWRKDDLGCTPERLSPFFEKPLQKKRRLLNLISSSVMPAAPIFPNANTLCAKQSALQELQAGVVAQRIKEKTTS